MLFSLLVLPACSNAYYDEGFEDGYADGYADGYFDAEYEMSSLADEEFEDGYDIGYDDGYDDGHSDGYYAGATYTCLFYGDLDRAFQSANNGCAWYTFIDAYDQYVSNIFDNDETRSELFWSLVSVTLDDDPTAEEIELLISTFGKDLFVRNGILLD